MPANFGSCINWVLRLEDRTLAGKVVDLGDGAGRTRFGISENNNPGLSPFFYTAPSAAVLEEAKQVYWVKYWNPICGVQMSTDEVAATLLSFAANDGVHEAVKLLQTVLGEGLTPDGGMGPKTLEVVLRGDPATIAANLRDAQEQFYRDLVTVKPEKERFLNGWLRRAGAVYPDLPS
jgi:lysozyme family protein